MTGYTAHSATIGAITGQTTIWSPRTPRVGTCGLILFPGQSSPKMYADGGTQYASAAMAAELADAGIPTITCEFYGNSWAKNQVIDTAIPALRAELATRFPLMRTDKVCVYGTSMGGSVVARYTQLHPDQVAAAVGIIPAYDPKAIYINNDAGDLAMEAAWAFTGLENFPDALDVGPKAALASSVPLLSAYSSDDALVPAATVTAYHALAGGLPENLINLGAVQHTIGAVSPTTVARFLVAHGA